jgi:hypothetical protein
MTYQKERRAVPPIPAAWAAQAVCQVQVSRLAGSTEQKEEREEREA